jgi:hypothetical protein
VVHLLCDMRGVPWLELEVCTRWIVLFQSYVASYVSPIQTGFLMGFRKSYGGRVIVIPVKKTPQEWNTQESRGFLQELTK